MANPFADLIPNKTSSSNPFADLIPDQKPDEESGFNPLSAGYKFFKGAEDLFQKAGTGMAKFGADDERKAEIDQYMQDREANIDKYAGDASDLWRMGGQVVGTGLAGGVTGNTGKLGRDALERVANVTAESGLFSAMTPGGSPGEDAAIGAGMSGVIEGGSRLMGKIPAAASKVASKIFPMSDDARKADVFAQSRNVPVAGEDLVQNTLVRSAGRGLDAIDPSNFRNRQIASYEEAFKKEMVDPFAEFADPIQEMGDSFKRQYQEVNQQKNKLYDAAYQELNPLGNVPMDEFRQGLQSVRDDVVRVLGEDTPEAALVDKWMNWGDVNFEDWTTRRKKLGRDIRKMERNADPDTFDVNTLYKIRDQLDTTLDQFGEGASDMYRNANQYFRERVLPYRQDAFMKKVKTGEIESAINDAMASSPTAQTNKRFKQVWGSLDESGRNAYRQSMIEQVVRKATNPETGFSPAVAASELKRLSNRLGGDVIGEDMVKALDGWNNLFEQSGFAGEQVARSRTGASVTQIAALPTALAGMATGVVSPQMLGMLVPSLMVRSRRFRQMLTKLADMKPQHKDYRTVAGDIMSELSREAARVQAAGGSE